MNKGSFQKLLSGFFPLRGYPPSPPYPLNGKSFCQKTLSGKGGTPPPLNGKSPKKISKNSSFLADFFLNGIGKYPPPLTENHCAQKSLADRGGYPPLNGQNPLKRF